MIKYFIQATEDMLLAGIIIGMIFGFAKKFFGKPGRLIVYIGTAAGVILSGVMSYLKNATKLIDTSMWNMRMFIVAVSMIVVFAVFAILKKKLRLISEIVMALSLTVNICVLFLYTLPDVLAYPYSILLVEKTVLSTTFLFKCIGLILGLILVYLTALAVDSGSKRLSNKNAILILSLALGVNVVRQVLNIIRIMVTKRLIKSNSTLFAIIKFSSNYDKLFLYLVMVIALVIPVILFIKSFNVNEPYSNNAQRRKIVYKWRVVRRWATLAVVCLILSTLNLTVFKTLASQEVELSPVEETEFDDTNVYVTFEQVEDGHLHRFSYITENGTEIRFIVIKKPNSSAYGIGLDACDICGETGYYEKNGQVVCKLCDVVMNINTIGFKGGCNPIVIPYSIENGRIIVPIEGLVEYEKEFK